VVKVRQALGKGLYQCSLHTSALVLVDDHHMRMGMSDWNWLSLTFARIDSKNLICTEKGLQAAHHTIKAYSTDSQPEAQTSFTLFESLQYAQSHRQSPLMTICNCSK
jgi:hypothetical protein